MTIYIIDQRNDIEVVVMTHLDIDANRAYKKFVLAFAKQLNLVVNPHWVDTVMDYELHNRHLTPDEFKKAKKMYGQFLNENDFKSYLINHCGGEVVDHQYSFKFGYN